MTGRFITIEGGEGAGKSTQIKILVARLRALGLEVVQTREPGGSPGAESLRELVVTGEAGRWSAKTELLIIYAARSDHLEKLIKPALEREAWVICDRFNDSTRAYQGAGGGIEPELIESLDQAIVGVNQPDLVLLMDMPVETGLKRAKLRAIAMGESEDRFESKGLEFHNRLRQAFLGLKATAPQRYSLIEADQDKDEVAKAIWQEVVAHFPELKGA